MNDALTSILILCTCIYHDSLTWMTSMYLSWWINFNPIYIYSIQVSSVCLSWCNNFQFMYLSWCINFNSLIYDSLNSATSLRSSRKPQLARNPRVIASPKLTQNSRNSMLGKWQKPAHWWCMYVCHWTGPLPDGTRQNFQAWVLW